MRGLAYFDKVRRI